MAMGSKPAAEVLKCVHVKHYSLLRRARRRFIGKAPEVQGAVESRAWCWRPLLDSGTSKGQQLAQLAGESQRGRGCLLLHIERLLFSSRSGPPVLTEAQPCPVGHSSSSITHSLLYAPFQTPRPQPHTLYGRVHTHKSARTHKYTKPLLLIPPILCNRSTLFTKPHTTVYYPSTPLYTPNSSQPSPRTSTRHPMLHRAHPTPCICTHQQHRWAVSFGLRKGHNYLYARTPHLHSHFLLI